MNSSRTCLVTGAAGFVGSHLVDRLLERGGRVVGVDNYRLGRRALLADALAHPAFTLIEADVNDWESVGVRVQRVLGRGQVDELWHLAANSDIRAGGVDPGVDLRDTFLSTFHALRLAQGLGATGFAFASSSAIYGAHPGLITEATGPLCPISNYGAMKLAAEAAISAALETQLERAWVFRFPNVVGSRATHGVILDFLRRLRAHPAELEVLGDGQQAKPYLHVSELVEAMLWIRERARERWNCYNLGPDRGVTRVAWIAERVVGRVAPGARIRYGTGPQGWPGDVPRFAYSIDKVKQLGWTPRLDSDGAVARAIEELAREGGA